MTLTLELPVKTKVNPEGNSHVLTQCMGFYCQSSVICKACGFCCKYIPKYQGLIYMIYHSMYGNVTENARDLSEKLKRSAGY